MLDPAYNPSEVHARLRDRGLSDPAARDKARLLRRCAESLLRLAPEASFPPAALYVPGRIEVLGKHTDYGGGRSLLMAAEQGLCALFLPREDDRVRIGWADGAGMTDFAIDPELQPGAGHWSGYPMTVARRIARNFPGRWRGADIVMASDLPPAAGMSSSSAMVVLSFLALSAVNGLDDREAYRQHIASREDLGGYLGCIENGQSFGMLEGDRGVGTFGGSEDHTAILCCESGRLSQYAFCPVRLERMLRMPEGFVMAVGVSGVVAEKTGDAREKYNRISLLTGRIVREWNESRPEAAPARSLAAALDEPGAMERLRETLAGRSDALSRLDQFIQESRQIIPAAGDALVRGDLLEFGKLVDLSQSLAEKCLGNQTAQTIRLARSARELGSAAASAFGAGFGGAVWAMVPVEGAEGFLQRWQADYHACFPQFESRFFLTRPGPAATLL